MVTVPDSLTPDFNTELEIGAFELECENLWDALVHEYFDQDEFAARTHGTHGTYQEGCTGPACLQARRLYTRGVRLGGASPYWEIFEKILSYFKGTLEAEIERTQKEALVALRDRVSNDFISGRPLKTSA